MLETAPLFSSKPVGEPAVVLHRFGGSYGAAKFLLTAAQEEIEGEIRVTLVNGWGVPVRVITLDNVKITQEVNSEVRIIGHQRQEFQKRRFNEQNQAFADLEQRIVIPKENTFATIHSFAASDDQFIEEQLTPSSYGPSLILAIARLVNTGTDNFAIWVVEAPYSSARVLHECVWSDKVTNVWVEWQQMFASRRLDISLGASTLPNPGLLDLASSASSQPVAYTARLMQHLGIRLWHWVFDGAILPCLERSLNIATGQNKRLRLRLEIRDPNLIGLPWEIMQREPGQSAMSLSQNMLFSRTTSEVEPLPYLQAEGALNILLVLGNNDQLQLSEEATILEQTLASGMVGSNSVGLAPAMVKTLLQPTPMELISELETTAYNVFFYAGHGLPGPDGGLLFVQPDKTLTGMELAQVLTSRGVKLAVFKWCWSAQPAVDVNHQVMPHSSLAEVLIRQGVPAVLTMRDAIADHESQSFIQYFAAALRARKLIDEAVCDARQQLLALYSFNQPAWTLPVLYMHPDFDGKLIYDIDPTDDEYKFAGLWKTYVLQNTAFLRSLSPDGQTYSLRPVITRIGRMTDNDIVIPEPWVSKRHAEILSRNFPFRTRTTKAGLFHLQDLSIYGTWILRSNSDSWQLINRQVIPLESGMQLKFGSKKSQPWEFIIEEGSHLC
ncbi:CHAT domain-containing protein [Iningainema sp. BLCCT55]|uniref:CHAT domain-containing protein n=1 Tax=Iningainema tapete BLCC-T55 TaxID=2748662 RepID=A0A8J6XFY8_9CYAN|nr:CHAT domain-containing protein [Iningainema tapete BLCC-T55]